MLLAQSELLLLLLLLLLLSIYSGRQVAWCSRMSIFC